MILSLGLVNLCMGMGDLAPWNQNEMVCKSDAPDDRIERHTMSLIQKSTRSSFKLDPWSRNAETPVWKDLKQQLLSEIGQERLYENSESTVPTTLVYLLSEYDQSILKPLRNEIQKEGNDGILNIHMIGATYMFEGLSDWKILAEWVPSYIRTIRIDLILGSPFQEDGPSKDEHGRRIKMDVSDDMQGQVNIKGVNVSFLNLGSHRRRKIRKKAKVEAEDLRRKSCGSHHFGTTGVVVEVKCHEKLYQDVWDSIPQPNLAVMVNPGFPLPNRRSFDGVLQRLLKNSIPTAVSAQQDFSGDHAKWEAHHTMQSLLKGTLVSAQLEIDGEQAREAHHAALWTNGRTAGVKLNLKKDFDDEAYQIYKTLQLYEAQVVATPSPFPYVYQDGQDVFLKNKVLAFFVGRKPDATPVKMLPPMREGRPSYQEQADPLLVAELTTALRTPVSRPYAQAMEAWARHSMSVCAGSKTVQDWMKCCHVEPDEIEC